MTNFLLIFLAVLTFNVGITLLSSDWWKKRHGDTALSNPTKDEIETKKKWQMLLKKYLVVYLLATLSDWLQGPYVYALYEKYGYSQHEIAILFVAGFGSSMIFGSFVGGMADAGGRKKFVILFSLIYASSCLTKHFNQFGILMLGRLLGGVATSLLFSVFEAWLIRAHADANLKHYLGKSFSWAAYGNSVIAIVAGLFANKASSTFEMIAIREDSIFMGGYLNPFDMALLALIACGVLAASSWEENYGASESSADDPRDGQFYDGLKNAFTTTIRSTDICLCGTISSLFEGSMYIFVFMWTPALTSKADTDQLPFGIIFSTFMVCCMAGSSIYSILIEKMKGEQLAVIIFAVAAFAMSLIAVSGSVTIRFLAMNLFEITVGMYWPVMGTLKGSIVPESKRAAIYNLYRIPLNFIVLFSLLTDLTPPQSFTLNAIMLTAAAGF
jgi:predicted MFS family arabinose efflux permease